jgi:putative ABC transport system ATP-binding protein
MDTLVRVRDVHKVYRRGSERIDVLQGVNLDIAEGDFLALMGPSGSGKTTLLNLLGGLDRQSAGTIEVKAARLDQMSGARLARWRAEHVGFVFQLCNLLPGAQRRTQRGAATPAHEPVPRRAQATGRGGRRSADEVLELLRILNRDHGKTIVMVTHDPQASGAAGRVLQLDKGRLIGEAAA